MNAAIREGLPGGADVNADDGMVASGGFEGQVREAASGAGAGGDDGGM